MKVMLQEDVHELQDMRMTLSALRSKVEDLITKHGETAIIESDGGHNNVSFNIYCEVTEAEIAEIIRQRRSGQPISLLKPEVRQRVIAQS